MIKAPNTLKIQVSLNGHEAETAIFLLSEAGCYAFVENEKGLEAYISEPDYQADIIKNALIDLTSGAYELEIMEPKDWNEAWEKEFMGIEIEDFCEIIPPFKESSGKCRHSLMIYPKMAFGTGHHQTTRLLLLHCQTIDFTEKRVLDMGTGTGILAIMAEKLGATSVLGIDIDPWSFENATENAVLNGCSRFKVILGDASAIPAEEFDIIFANINRNILLQDGERYFKCLAEKGVLLLSGFYDFDKDKIIRNFTALGLAFSQEKCDENWVSLAFYKP